VLRFFGSVTESPGCAAPAHAQWQVVLRAERDVVAATLADVQSAAPVGGRIPKAAVVEPNTLAPGARYLARLLLADDVAALELAAGGDYSQVFTYDSAEFRTIAPPRGGVTACSRSPGEEYNASSSTWLRKHV